MCIFKVCMCVWEFLYACMHSHVFGYNVWVISDFSLCSDCSTLMHSLVHQAEHTQQPRMVANQGIYKPFLMPAWDCPRDPIQSSGLWWWNGWLSFAHCVYFHNTLQYFQLFFPLHSSCSIATWKCTEEFRKQKMHQRSQGICISKKTLPSGGWVGWLCVRHWKWQSPFLQKA